MILAGTLHLIYIGWVPLWGVHPVPFGTATGFRFNFTYTTDDGLEMKGTAVIAQRGRLDVILFTAPSEYYFDHYLPMVEEVFTSIRAGG